MSVITAADVEAARDVLVISKADVITPLARDRAKELGIRIERSGVAGNGSEANGAGGKSSIANGAPAKGSIANGRTHAAQRETLAGLPPAKARRVPQHAVHAPRSGTLYRRGGYGLNGERKITNESNDAAATSTRPAVAVIGAGHVGAATAIRLAESDAFDRLTLIDVVDGLAAGLALDMWHSAGLQKFTTRVTGSTRIEDVAGADIVVITAGRPRKPGMTRTDLTAANAEIIRGVAGVIRDRAPDAVVVVVTNPLEEMTFLAAKITGFPAERVIGMGGVLDTARFRSLVGLTGVAKPEDVRALVLGSHGDEMVVPLSQATANGVPLEQLLDAQTLADIVARTRASGAEVTKLMQTGSAFVSPGSAIARQIEVIVRGADDVVPACVASGRAYGLPDVRIGLPVRLGPRGVREIVKLELRAAEVRALREAAEHIRARTAALT